MVGAQTCCFSLYERRAAKGRLVTYLMFFITYTGRLHDITDRVTRNGNTLGRGIASLERRFSLDQNMYSRPKAFNCGMYSRPKAFNCGMYSRRPETFNCGMY